MVKPLRSKEVPFLIKIPSDRMGLLHHDLTKVELTRVEVFPKQGKWILHLSTSFELENSSLLDLESLLMAQVPEIKVRFWL
ncbi:hypothetical protein [Desulfosporosinus sp. BICA1-9]|uniref:hypothetical protein n=1 Tax=Desulfosporosinus sp. BICA1-9 TaxID=1531958 RepID=UPI00054BD45D|nr:hypothetical protein [Desulfosporosinus sp. BICA1-9]KJS45928.1 MAG: hypothetical protein VR66_28270 [Peptococcaceae bacterium BRH_c23]KJS85742.1 MAG: hypothetical protein JL57_18335 [Desulfosporosinus sp. BICA1-9]HBW39072.1 hypothetical protein [Desulfosporosinus sp.]